MTTAEADAPTALQRGVLEWFAGHARDLPWRDPAAGAWGVLVSEIMLQQTPVVRVEPAWRAWMTRWPTPADLAAASPAEVLRAWDRLGYPRRALRLREAARAITERHGGTVPHNEADLLSLPGIGSYTAGAVRAFAYRQRAVVLDTNVRRVLERAAGGAALPPPTLRRGESERAATLMPRDNDTSATWSAGLMELGALVCTARAPRCGACPLAGLCRWRSAGYPPDEHSARRRTQAWQGTDRQVRGRVLAALRAAEQGVTPADLVNVWPLAAQRERALASLLADSLIAVEPDADGVALAYHLPHA